MASRHKSIREQYIIEQLLLRERVSVAELKVEMDISEVSVRKYLTDLEAQGKLIRQYGGAVLAQAPALSSPEGLDDLPQIERSPIKNALAQVAVSLIKPHSRIVIDSGTTTACMVPYLTQIEGLVVMTNSLRVANALTAKDSQAKVLMTGGTWDAVSQSFQGQTAQKMLLNYNFDQAFLGAAGLDISQGTTTFNELTNLSREMAQVSSQTVILAQSDKFQKKMPNIELGWDKVSTLITDNNISQSSITLLEQRAVDVRIAAI